MRIIGYGLTTKGEAGRYMEATLKEFARLCDDTVILCNNVGQEEIDLINKYGFKYIVDDRIWGENQHKLKETLMLEVAKLNPDYCVCLDMDEVLDPEFTRETIEKYIDLKGMYVYIVNLWDEGWNRQWSFWNIRAWKWTGDMKFSNRPLHCGLAPESAYHYGSYIPYYLKHYGLKNRADRMKKVERYQKFDPKAIYKDVSYYNELSGGIASFLDYGIIKEKIVEEVGSPKIKNINNKPKMKYIYVKNPHGVIIDIPETQLEETLARGGFHVIGEASNTKQIEVPVVGIMEADVANTKPKLTVTCDECGFEFKSTAGLKKHQLTHK